MAIKTETVITRVDDLDGTSGPDVKTRRYTIDVELELSDANHAAMTNQLAAIFPPGKARPAKKNGNGSRKPADKGEQEFNRRVREWAQARGHQVAKSGRPAKHLINAYIAETGESR